MKRLAVLFLVVFGLIFGSFGISSAMGGGGKHSKLHKTAKPSQVAQDERQFTGEDKVPVGDSSDLSQAPLPVPEPGTLVLLGIGLAGLVLYKSKK